MESQHRQDHHPLKLWNRHLIWLLLIQTITAFAYNGYVPLIPFIQQEFVLTKTQVGYLTSAVFLGSSLIAIPSGVIVDRIGVRKTLLIFCSVVTFVLFFFFIATNYFLVLVLLFLLGMGYGGITPGTNRGIMEYFPITNRGTAMGIKQTGVPLGIALAALVLPTIATSYGWKISLFSVSIILFGLTFVTFIGTIVISKLLQNQAKISGNPKSQTDYIQQESTQTICRYYLFHLDSAKYGHISCDLSCGRYSKGFSVCVYISCFFADRWNLWKSWMGIYK